MCVFFNKVGLGLFYCNVASLFVLFIKIINFFFFMTTMSFSFFGHFEIPIFFFNYYY